MSNTSSPPVSRSSTPVSVCSDSDDGFMIAPRAPTKTLSSSMNKLNLDSKGASTTTATITENAASPEVKTGIEDTSPSVRLYGGGMAAAFPSVEDEALGSSAREQRLKNMARAFSPTIIAGPPCEAYNASSRTQSFPGYMQSAYYTPPAFMAPIAPINEGQYTPIGYPAPLPPNQVFDEAFPSSYRSKRRGATARHQYGSSWGGVAEPKQHERFYLSDGNVVFQVNNTLYKIHRFFIESSPVLSARARQPSSSHNPWTHQLYEVDCKAFELLLSIFYPKDHLKCDATTVEDWKSILSTASTFCMPKITKLATEELASIASPVEKLAIAGQYGIHEWTIPACRDLILQEEPITVPDAYSITPRELIIIAGLREELGKNWRQYVDVAKVEAMVKSRVEPDGGFRF